MAAKKKLTNAQKKMNAKIKKELQAEGILPPDKQKLNRKKFLEEAIREWNERDSNCFIWDIYVYEAISMMLAHREKKLTVSKEAVGAAKVVKLAIRLKEFSDNLRAENRTTYTLGEKLEYIKDIFEA